MNGGKQVLYYDSIYLSPHLDDAAYSCGGQIYQQTAVGQTVLIVSIMAGEAPPGKLSEFAQSLHGRWRLNDIKSAVKERRAEDREACRLLGADYLHWDWPDCIYRRDPISGEPLYPTVEAIFGAIHPAESSRIVELAEQLASLPPHGRLIVPLSVGNHVDHQLTRTAVEQAHPSSLYYYEDYPYLQQPGAVEKVVGDNTAWQPETIPLSTAALQTRINAIALFRSQVSTFFNDRADLEEQVRSCVQKRGGERIWQKGE